MDSFDYKKDLKHLYLTSAKDVVVVDVPPMNFAIVDGEGAPNTSKAFENAIGALYGITYTIKMMPKKGIVPPGYVIYNIPPLEGLWWTSDGGRFNEAAGKDALCWTIMIMQPPFVTPELVAAAIDDLAKKKPENPAFGRLRFGLFEEGPSVQLLHVGPYSDEPRSLARMESFAREHGLAYHGKHHEIYLGDPRRCAPGKLRTVLRQPVHKAD